MRTSLSLQWFSRGAILLPMPRGWGCWVKFGAICDCVTAGGGGAVFTEWVGASGAAQTRHAQERLTAKNGPAQITTVLMRRNSEVLIILAPCFLPSIEFSGNLGLCA